MTRAALVIDEARCVGCFGCEIACNQLNGLPPGVRWIHVEQDGPKFVDGKLRLGWTVRVDRQCNLCGSRREEGMQPACVQHCIAGCISVSQS